MGDEVVDGVVLALADGELEIVFEAITDGVVVPLAVLVAITEGVTVGEVVGGGAYSIP